jgi:hypothetical protein
MPKWIHDRAKHIRAKNPDMPESESWAIATNQFKSKESSEKVKTAHLLPFLDGFSDELMKIAGLKSWIGKKLMSTVTDVPENRRAAEDFIRSNAAKGVKDMAGNGLRKAVPWAGGALAGAGAMYAGHKLLRRNDPRPGEVPQQNKFAGAIQGTPTAMTEIKSTIPRNPMKTSIPKYTKVNPDSPGSPAAQLQPVLSPPPVRG